MPVDDNEDFILKDNIPSTKSLPCSVVRNMRFRAILALAPYKDKCSVSRGFYEQDTAC